jgi:hypothetical protein
MASKLEGLDRQLTWADFGKPRAGSPPAPGKTATAAFTDVSISTSSISFPPLPGSKPFRFQLSDTVTVRIVFNPAKSFVMSWVFSGSTTGSPDDLLKHEQGHYSIAALIARDFFVDLLLLKTKIYLSQTDALKEVTQIRKSTLDKVQKVNDLYDTETQNGQIAAAQKQWNDFFDTAFLQKRLLLPFRCEVADWFAPPDPTKAPLLGPDGEPLKKRLLDVLNDAGKKI